MKTKSVIPSMFFIALVSFASAQDQSAVQSKQINVPLQGAYIDSNNNGICDNFESYGRGGRCYCSAGYGRGYGFRRGRGPATAQAIANRQGLPQRQGRGLSHAYGRGPGPGYGRGLGGRRFIDADKNGICDIYETSVKKN